MSILFRERLSEVFSFERSVQRRETSARPSWASYLGMGDMRSLFMGILFSRERDFRSSFTGVLLGEG